MDDDALGWDLNERDRLLAAGELDHADRRTIVVLPEDA